MTSRAAWLGLALLLACQRGEQRSTIMGPELSTCPPTDENTFVLFYDARDGSVQPRDPGRFPMGGQRVVLCVVSPDFRDVYDVTTRREVLGEEELFEARTIELGEIATERGEAWEDPGQREAAREEPWTEGFDPLAVATDLANAMSLVEQARWQVVQLIRDAYSTSLTSADLAELRDEVRHVLRPLDRARQPDDSGRLLQGECHANGAPSPESSPSRCSLEQYVNRYELPDEIHIVGGQAFWMVGGQPTRIEEAPRVSGTIRRLASELLRLLAEIEELESFSESLFQSTVRPRLVFDLGRFGDDRLVTITIVRHRRNVQVQQRQVKATWDRQVSVHQQEVHGFTYFRVEPGFAFSALRRPRYAVGPNDLGDQVIRVEDEGRRVFHPTVFASFYWCGVDVRASPIRRACPAIRNRGLARLVPFLPTFTLGIPLDDTLVNGQGNLFVGALFNWIPYVSIGIGAHLGFGVNQLRDGYRVGDPVSFSSTDLAAFTRGGTSVAPYLSITIAPDAFAALTDFKSD